LWEGERIGTETQEFLKKKKIREGCDDKDIAAIKRKGVGEVGGAVQGDIPQSNPNIHSDQM
jgi:hypothetical protein